VTATDGPAQDHRPGAVLVTGGASGLGAAVALAVGDAGGRPFVLDLVAPPFNVDHELVDLADRGVAAAAVERAAERLGRLADQAEREARRARATAAAAIEAASAARERATRAARELREAEDRIPAGH
jgi:nucleoside-diphosphate-sugar epimerase